MAGASTVADDVATRKDAVRNRRKLLEAAGELIRTSPGDTTMPKVARRAGLSTATAYRYFPSLDALLSHYLYSVIVELRDFSHDCTETGPALFERVIQEWLRLLESYGPTMIQLRSRSGLLQRLHDRDPIITTVRDAWERPIRAILRSERVGDQHFETALLLYNQMFDAREIADLQATGLSTDEIRRRLITVYRAAVRAWADAA